MCVCLGVELDKDGNPVSCGPYVQKVGLSLFYIDITQSVCMYVFELELDKDGTATRCHVGHMCRR